MRARAESVIGRRVELALTSPAWFSGLPFRLWVVIGGSGRARLTAIREDFGIDGIVAAGDVGRGLARIDRGLWESEGCRAHFETLADRIEPLVQRVCAGHHATGENGALRGRLARRRMRGPRSGQ